MTSGRLHVIPWFHSQAKLCQPLHTFTPPLVLGFVGRITYEKGVHILLQALSQVNASPPLILKIAGTTNNDYARRLQAKFPDQAGCHRVVWAGWVPNDNLDSFYEDVHVAVVPSLWYDNTPIALVEALAHGRSVICTDVPSMTHLVQPSINGLVFPMGDTKALATHLEYIARYPQAILELAKNTRNVLSADAYIQRLITVYDQIMT
jgi:glycosyltransferase involved in cell wall biosynthesis